MKKRIELSEAKKIIDSTKGKFFTVYFKKRTNGETRIMNCRLNVLKYVTGKGMWYNPEKYNLIPVYDMIAKGYRHINIDGIYCIKYAKNEYYTDEIIETVNMKG